MKQNNFQFRPTNHLYDHQYFIEDGPLEKGAIKYVTWVLKTTIWFAEKKLYLVGVLSQASGYTSDDPLFCFEFLFKSADPLSLSDGVLQISIRSDVVRDWQNFAVGHGGHCQKDDQEFHDDSKQLTTSQNSLLIYTGDRKDSARLVHTNADMDLIDLLRFYDSGTRLAIIERF